MKERASKLPGSGPWPFTTQRAESRGGRRRAWSSRQHRKGLFASHSLNWWIGSVFALGATFFVLASVLSLRPAWAAACGLSPFLVNALFFVGSLPFTTAAYLQLFQAANAGVSLEGAARASSRALVFGFRPQDIGWLSSALQFVGTLLFNFNTFDALLSGLTWKEADLIIWAPNLAGSVLFLLSGYLAFMETSHKHWSFEPHNHEWRIASVNLLGCVGFMAAALSSIYLPGPAHPEAEFFALAFTLQGALCFLLGALLMLPEAEYGAIVPRS